jgi:hypothetical protein
MAQERPRMTDYLRYDDERPFLNKALDHKLGDDDRIR